MNRIAAHPRLVTLLALACALSAGIALCLKRVEWYDDTGPPDERLVVVEKPVPPVPRVPVAKLFAPITACGPLDLDSDGIAEDFDEVADSCGTGGCSYRVTLSKTKRYAGDVAGHCPLRAEPHKDKPKLPFDLLTDWRMGARETWTTRYEYSRGMYRATSEQRCDGTTCTKWQPIKP